MACDGRTPGIFFLGRPVFYTDVLRLVSPKGPTIIGAKARENFLFTKSSRLSESDLLSITFIETFQ